MLLEEVHMNANIALLTSNPYGTLLKETFGKMLLDSACSKTCAGRLWYEEICSSMSELDKKDIVEKPTSTELFSDLAMVLRVTVLNVLRFQSTLGT